MNILDIKREDLEHLMVLLQECREVIQEEANEGAWTSDDFTDEEWNGMLVDKFFELREKLLHGGKPNAQ